MNGEAGEGAESGEVAKRRWMIFRLSSKLVQLDRDWRDNFLKRTLHRGPRRRTREKRQFMFDSLVAATSLAESLLEQVRDAGLAAADIPVAEVIIGNIDDYGYLKASVEEVAVIANVPGDKILEVLRVIQTFEPAGVGARDLRECLMIQLERDKAAGDAGIRNRAGLYGCARQAAYPGNRARHGSDR